VAQSAGVMAQTSSGPCRQLASALFPYKLQEVRCEVQLPRTRAAPCKHVRRRLLPDGDRFSEDRLRALPECGGASRKPAAADSGLLQAPQNCWCPGRQRQSRRQKCCQSRGQSRTKALQAGGKGAGPQPRCPLSRSPPSAAPGSCRHHRTRSCGGRYAPLPDPDLVVDHPAMGRRNGPDEAGELPLARAKPSSQKAKTAFLEQAQPQCNRLARRPSWPGDGSGPDPGDSRVDARLFSRLSAAAESPWLSPAALEFAEACSPSSTAVSGGP